jgi:photoactive yellow protein
MTDKWLSQYTSCATMTAAELDELPFGAIQLDPNGVILQYNRFEAQLAGIRAGRARGKNFFTEIAPCTDVKEFHGRFTEGVARKQMHEKFRYYFPFKSNPTHVMVTLFYSHETDSAWVFIQPVK